MGFVDGIGHPLATLFCVASRTRDGIPGGLRAGEPTEPRGERSAKGRCPGQFDAVAAYPPQIPRRHEGEDAFQATWHILSEFELLGRERGVASLSGASAPRGMPVVAVCVSETDLRPLGGVQPCKVDDVGTARAEQGRRLAPSAG